MKDYDVWYDSPVFGMMIIGNVVAETQIKALKIAKARYDKPRRITVQLS